MEQPGGQIWVGIIDSKVYVRVAGRATHLHGAPLRAFAREMVRRGSRHFELDLGKCTSMDSTFLGVLAGVSQLLENNGAARIVLTRVGTRNLELFKLLGIDRFFHLQGAGVAPTAEELDLSLLPSKGTSREEWAGTVVEAHQLLSEVDERNQPRFKELLAYLREDLAESGLTRPDNAPSWRWKH